MNPQGISLLQRIIDELEAVLQAGLPDVLVVLFGFLTFFALLALAWTLYAIQRGGPAFGAAAGLLVRIVIVIWCLNNFAWLLNGLRDLALTLGSMVTGGRLQSEVLLDPGSVMRLGIDAAVPLWQAFSKNLGWTTPVLAFAYLLSYLAFVTSYMVISYKIFWFQIEQLLSSVAGLILLPALAFRPTAFVAQGVLSYAANAFCRFLISAILISALWNTLQNLANLSRPAPVVTMQNLDLSMQEAFVAAGMAIVIAACFLSVNRLAGVLTSGVPSLAGGNALGSLLRTMGGIASGGATMAAGALTGSLGAARVGAGGLQGTVGAIRALPAARTAGSLGGAVRQITAGSSTGMAGGMQARIGQLMATTQRLGDRAGEQTLQQFLRARQGGDIMHRGLR